MCAAPQAPRARPVAAHMKVMRKVTRRTFPDGTMVIEVITTDTEMSAVDLAVERALEPPTA